MKNTIIKEVHLCDKCFQEADYPRACMECGVEMCLKCWEGLGVDYSHAVFYGGSGDGYYCKSCDQKLIDSATNEKHTAYRLIKDLKLEANEWNDEFKRRSKAAEENLKRLK